MRRAEKFGGTLVLRNEDLDPQRSRPEFARAMLEDLCWIGFHWSEGPDCGGPYAPYTQSERREHHLNAWRKLRDTGAIYPCTCSRNELALAATAPNDIDDEPIYPGKCRNRTDGPAFDRPQGANWRFRVPDGQAISFEDQGMGQQSFVTGQHFGDFVVWRRDDVPAYQLAVVVDDAHMKITEVVRGADLLKSTARQILLFRALGLAQPDFYHCALVRDQTGIRMAKRHNAASIRHLRESGWTPQQVLQRAEELLADK